MVFGGVFGVYFGFLGRGPGFFALGSCGKPQRGRKATAPLHTPQAFFENFLVVGMCDRVGLFLYSSVLDVGRCADMGVSASIVVGVTLSTFVCMLRCWMWNAVPIVAV